MSRRHKAWSEEEDQYMRENYSDMRTSDMAAALSRTHNSVIMRAKTLGLRKSAEFMRSPDSGRRQPGQASWNKGKRLFFSECGTGYKRRPAKTVPVGTVSFHERNRQWHIKVMEHPDHRKAWRPYTEYVWTQAGNELPEGYVVAFKQGFATTSLEDITADKLEAISRRELMNRNSIQRYPSELHGLMIQLGNMRKELDEDD